MPPRTPAAGPRIRPPSPPPPPPRPRSPGAGCWHSRTPGGRRVQWRRRPRRAGTAGTPHRSRPAPPPSRDWTAARRAPHPPYPAAAVHLRQARRWFPRPTLRRLPPAAARVGAPAAPAPVPGSASARAFPLQDACRRPIPGAARPPRTAGAAGSGAPPRCGCARRGSRGGCAKSPRCAR
ncbi:hypothetical protein D9M71_698940 [compost metagenome]